MAAAHLAAMARFTGGLEDGPAPASAGAPDGPASAPDRPPVELVLYVTDSMASLRAIRNLRTALEQYDAARVRLRICDLTREPLGGVLDRVAFTPMLIRRTPGPRESLLGDLRDGDRIHDLLRAGAPAQDHE